MKLVVTILLIFLSQAFATAADWDADSTVFIEESCVACHDADTDTSLDLTSLGFDLENEDVFRTWVKVFDRVERHEMPPESDPQSNGDHASANRGSLNPTVRPLKSLRTMK